MKNITIVDIAKLTGFSVKTVSRVVNNEDNVKESTREKILKVIEETKYRPNIYARNLGNKLDKNILISIKKERGALTTRWVNILLDEIIPHLNRYGFSILIEEYYDSVDIKKSLICNSSTFIDGIIIFYESDNDKRIKAAKKFNTPYVIFGEGNDENVTYVSNDNFEGAKLGVDYLLNRDLQTIELILGNPSLVNKNRELGARKAFLDSNADPLGLNVIYGLTSPQKAYEYTINLGRLNKIPNAIFISGDEKAIGVLKALEKLGKRVPEDVSVLGFDDLPISQFYTPALTTIAQNYKVLGQEVATKLYNLINGAEEGSIKVKNKLVLRESVR